MKVTYLDNNDFKFKELIHIKYIQDYGEFFIAKDNKGNKITYRNCELLIIEEYTKKGSK